MVTEIELKAHVRDSEALRLLLAEKAEYLGSFEKNDTYWSNDKINFGEIHPGVPGLPPSGLRVRTENRVLPDGTNMEATFATYKNKEVRDGIEINNEQEFEVRSRSCHSIPVFEDFLRRIGLKPGAAKKKRGWAFSYEGITVELLEVESLGWFVELEIIADNNREETFARGKQRLLDFLATIGIAKEAIESRFYSEMLNC